MIKKTFGMGMLIGSFFFLAFSFCVQPVYGAVVSTNIGFAYVRPTGLPLTPEGTYCGEDWLVKYNDPLYSTCKARFFQDVKVMAALGVKRIKLTLGPEQGLTFNYTTCGGATDNSGLANLKTSVPQVIKVLGSHGIKVILDFLTNDLYLNSSYGFYPSNKDPNGNTVNWWSQCYQCQSGTEDDKAERMTADIVRFENTIVNAVQADSAAAENVDYYLLITEGNYDNWIVWSANVQSHVTKGVLSQVNVPSGKLGADTGQCVSCYIQSLQADATAVTKSIDVTEVHPYPPQTPTQNQPCRVLLGVDISAASTVIPSARVVIGEMGSNYCENASNESYQIANPCSGGVGDMLTQAGDAGVAYAINWNLWDYNGPPNECSTTNWRIGLGAAISAPRDLFGFLAERAAPSLSGDFEGGSLSGWTAGGNDGNYGLSVQSSDAAIGSHFARLTSSSSVYHWVCSPTLSVSGMTKFAVGGYVRTDVGQSLYVNLHYHTAGGDWSIDYKQKNWNNAGFIWKNIQDLADATGGTAAPFQFGPYSNVDQVFVCFMGASADSSTHYIDVDAISIAGYEGGCSDRLVRLARTTPLYFTSLQEAYNAAVNGDVIQSLAGTLVENVSVNKNISTTLQGGYDCGYTTNSGKVTNLKGKLQTVSGGGTLTIGNFNIIQ